MVVQQESVGLVATKRKVRDGQCVRHCPRCNYINYYSKYYYFANMQCNCPDPNLQTTSGEVYMTASQGT